MTVPQRLCFSAQLSNCNVAACWNAVPVSTLHLSYKIHSSKCFGCSIKFFHLATTEHCLGESWSLASSPLHNWTCAVQEHASTTLDAIGSAERFFALLRTTHACNLTHVYYSFIRSGYRFWEFTVSVSMSSRHRHQ